MLNFNKKLYLIVPFLFLSICVFSSCSSQDQDSSSLGSKVYISSVKAKGFAPGQLESHYLKHKHEFDNITQEEYLARAMELLNASASKDVLEKIRSNGDVLHYRPQTREFAVMTGTGRIKTFFKADYRYWSRQ